MRSKLLTVALAGLVPIAATGSALAVDLPASAGASIDCSASIDPYTQAASVDQSCGD